MTGTTTARVQKSDVLDCRVGGSQVAALRKRGRPLTHLRWAVIGLLLAAGCQAPRTVIKPGYDFSRVKTVAVIEQKQEDRRAVTDEAVRQLLRYGFDVRVAPSVNAAAKSDVVLQINVSQYVPDRKYLVQTGNGSGGTRDVIVVNPTVEISGRTVYPAMGVPGLDDSQIIVSNATVALSARLVDAGSRETLWSDAVTYEGLDLDAAVQGAVAALLKRFPRKG